MSDNGGSAFPWCGDLNESPTINLGMTLRDYFAAKAMQMQNVNAYNLGDDEAHYEIAERAYRIADAMLKARIK